MKKVLHVLLIAVWMLVSGVMIRAEENLEYPEFTGEFHEYGFSVTCEDQDFLNSIDQIKMTSVDNSGEYSFTNDQWVIRDHELFLPCEVYWSEGLTRMTKSIEMIVDGNSTPAFLSNPVNTSPSDVVMTIENKMDLVISSSDEYWMSLMMSQGDQVAIHLWGENQSISSNELVYRDGKIILSEQVLKNHQLKEGEKYSLLAHSFPNYKSYELPEITYTTIRDGETYHDLVYVSDVEAAFTDYGLKVKSNDLNYIQGIDQLMIELDDTRVVLTDGWKFVDGELFLPCSVLFENGLRTGKHYQIIISSKGYFDERRQSYLDQQQAADVVLSINQKNDIVISSSDETWMKFLVESPQEDVIWLIEGSTVQVQFDYTDLRYENGQVLIPYEVQQKYNLLPGSTFQMKSRMIDGYYGWCDLGELIISYHHTDQEYEDLITPPEYTAEFTAYGLSIVSEDEDFLRSIDQIQIVGDHLITISSDDITSDENGRFVLCGHYLSKGLKPNYHYSIVVSSKGYFDSVKRDYLMFGNAQNVEMTLNEVGDIVITSPDLYWLKVMAETMNDHTIGVNYDRHHHYRYLPNTALIYEETQIRIPSIVQKQYGLFTNSSYLLGTGKIIGGYYYQDWGTVMITHGLIGYGPSDALTRMNELGQIEITSSDKEWLQDILLAKTEMGNSSLVIEKSTGETIEFYNDENNTDLIYQDGKVIIDFETVKQRGLTPGEYNCDINSANYAQKNTTLKVGAYSNPTDIQIKVDSNSGDIIITSSDELWLQSLVELRDEYAAIYVTTDSGNTHFWNTEDTTDLVFDGSRVIITKEAQRKRGLVQKETVQFQFYSDVYHYSELYEVTVGKGGCKKLPDDIQVGVVSNGNIVVKSSDLNWLKSLTELHDDEYAAVYVTTDSGNAWFWNDSNETDLYFEGNRVVIKPEAQQRRGLYQNEIIQLYFFSYEYGPTKEFQIQIGTGGLKKVPDDLVLIQDQNGNVLIQTSDQEYLDVLLDGSVQFISDELNIVWIFKKDALEENSGVMISVEILQERSMINGEYVVQLNAAGYPMAKLNAQFTNLKERCPEEVTIVFDENEGIVISCPNSEYIQSITVIEMYAKNGEQIYTYDDLQGIREEFRYVIPIEEMIKDGVNPDTYSIYVFSEMYGIELYTFELNSEQFKVNDIVRIKGETRFETSLKIADTLKDTLEIEKFDVVILANGRDFADALAGSVLAIQKNAPILMVDSKNNNMSEIIAYLFENLKSSGNVILLGGEAAVPTFVEDSLEANGFSYERIKGKNRYETNIEILKKAGIDSDVILVANGKSFADSLSASATGYPILLVGNTLNDAQKQFLSEHVGKHFVILGGTGAVNDEVQQMLKEYGTTERVYGKTRYETSIEIAKRFFPDADEMVLAYAKNYPDGLCGGPLAYVMNAPLILTATGNPAAKEYNLTVWIVRGAVLGGESLISDDAVAEIFYKYPVIKS